MTDFFKKKYNYKSNLIDNKENKKITLKSIFDVINDISGEDDINDEDDINNQDDINYENDINNNKKNAKNSNKLKKKLKNSNKKIKKKSYTNKRLPNALKIRGEFTALFAKKHNINLREAMILTGKKGKYHKEWLEYKNKYSK